MPTTNNPARNCGFLFQAYSRSEIFSERYSYFISNRLQIETDECV